MVGLQNSPFLASRKVYFPTSSPAVWENKVQYTSGEGHGSEADRWDSK